LFPGVVRRNSFVGITSAHKVPRDFANRFIGTDIGLDVVELASFTGHGIELRRGEGDHFRHLGHRFLHRHGGGFFGACVVTSLVIVGIRESFGKFVLLFQKLVL